ncbi:hypothetical protein ACVWZZ_008238 [Bradyrhizobium sp. LM6.10]
MPGVVAMLTPTTRLSGLDWRIFRTPLPAAMSSASIFRPRARFSPLLATVARSTSGLVSTKLDGDSALVTCWM